MSSRMNAKKVEPVRYIDMGCHSEKLDSTLKELHPLANCYA